MGWLVSPDRQADEQRIMLRQIRRQRFGGADVLVDQLHVAVFEQAVDRRVLGQVAGVLQHQQAATGRLAAGRQRVAALCLQGLALDRQAEISLADREEGGGEIHPQVRVVLILLGLFEQRLGNLAQVAAGDAQAQEGREADEIEFGAERHGGARGAGVVRTVAIIGPRCGADYHRVSQKRHCRHAIICGFGLASGKKGLVGQYACHCLMGSL